MKHIALDGTKSLCGEYTTLLSHVISQSDCKKCAKIYKENMLYELKKAERNLQRIMKKLEGKKMR